MKFLFHILPFFICFSLLIPTAFAEEVPPENSLLIYTPDESEEISSDDTTPPDSSESVLPETEASEPSQSDTLPPEPEQPSIESQDSTTPVTSPPTTSETTPVTEGTQDVDMNSLQQIMDSLQNTEFATQTIAGFLLFFVVCVLCYFCYKFFKIFF